MNKQLITTYFEEFKHWLNGGKVQVFYKKDTLPRWITDDECISCEDIDNFTNILQNSLETEDVLIAIDDYYSEFRIAMAEGKTIEYLRYTKEWKNLVEHGRRLEGIPLKELRIKPKEPKFKTGDWVIHNGDVKRVTKVVDGYINSLDNEVAVIMKEESLELWEPKPNEWCWFWNEPSDIPILVKLISIEYFLEKPIEYKVETPSCISETSYSYMKYMYFKNCEPFIGQLPSILKK